MHRYIRQNPDYPKSGTTTRGDIHMQRRLIELTDVVSHLCDTSYRVYMLLCLPKSFLDFSYALRLSSGPLCSSAILHSILPLFVTLPLLHFHLRRGKKSFLANWVEFSQTGPGPSAEWNSTRSLASELRPFLRIGELGWIFTNWSRSTRIFGELGWIFTNWSRSTRRVKFNPQLSERVTTILTHFFVSEWQMQMLCVRTSSCSPSYFSGVLAQVDAHAPHDVFMYAANFAEKIG